MRWDCALYYCGPNRGFVLMCFKNKKFNLTGRKTISIPCQDPAFITQTVLLLTADDGSQYAIQGVGSIEWIKINGDYLSFKQAKHHFPTIDIRDYSV